jgi:hypothetical protein
VLAKSGGGERKKPHRECESEGPLRFGHRPGVHGRITTRCS